MELNIKKQCQPYHKRIRNDFIPFFLIWCFAYFGILYYLSAIKADYWIGGLIFILVFIFVLFNSFKSAEYAITEVRMTKNSFLVRFYEGSIEKTISSSNTNNITIVLNRQSRGIFPLNDKNRIVSLEIKNNKDITLVRQHSSGAWKSADLHELFYDGFEKHYNWYWRQMFDIQFVKNN